MWHSLGVVESVYVVTKSKHPNSLTTDQQMAFYCTWYNVIIKMAQIYNMDTFLCRLCNFISFAARLWPENVHLVKGCIKWNLCVLCV